MGFFEDKRVLVTGSKGFLGRHLVPLLEAAVGEGGELIETSYRCHVERGKPNNTYMVDLRHPDQVDDLFVGLGPFDYVFHLAGYNGGIAFNEALPAHIFHDNTLMALNVLQACANYDVKKVLSVVASCAYGDGRTFPDDFIFADEGILEEERFLRGRPNPSVAGHGYAKRNLQLASGFYRDQYGLSAVCVCPTTLYGPGDSYDPQRTKVMGAMVKRFADAVRHGEQEVQCWGSGRPLREFLYVKDCASLLLTAMEHWDRSDIPLNLGTGQELSVRQVAEAVAAGVGFFGSITWDTSKPDGQFRKRLDTTLQREVLGDFDFTPLDEGIRMTVADYLERNA